MKKEITNNELKILVKVINHSFPEFLNMVGNLKDPSKKKSRL